ncbi:hypothetical protein [Gimesia sp.]|uniref:hypothetical protein n=1 Tax=Gimesia sp. TaxID=2024833 RepID=UPI003A9594EB
MARLLPLTLLIILCVWSITSLVIYRSDAGHGPDIVGEEVSRFAVPLVLALMASFCHLVVALRVMKQAITTALFPLFAVLVLAAIEVGIYIAVIVR